VKPKPIVTNTFVVAALDGPTPRYLCRDRRHGHWVVTIDHRKAMTFPSEREAARAAADYGRMTTKHFFTRPGDWRAYAVSTRLTFAEASAEAA
jgi:hypothetical protein